MGWGGGEDCLWCVGGRTKSGERVGWFIAFLFFFIVMVFQ